MSAVFSNSILYLYYMTSLQQHSMQLKRILHWNSVFLDLSFPPGLKVCSKKFVWAPSWRNFSKLPWCNEVSWDLLSTDIWTSKSNISNSLEHAADMYLVELSFKYSFTMKPLWLYVNINLLCVCQVCSQLLSEDFTSSASRLQITWKVTWVSTCTGTTSQSSSTWT